MQYIIKPNGARVRIPTQPDEMHIQRSTISVENEETYNRKVKIARLVVPSMFPLLVILFGFIIQNSDKLVVLSNNINTVTKAVMFWQ